MGTSPALLRSPRDGYRRCRILVLVDGGVPTQPAWPGERAASRGCPWGVAVHDPAVDPRCRGHGAGAVGSDAAQASGDPERARSDPVAGHRRGNSGTVPNPHPVRADVFGGPDPAAVGAGAWARNGFLTEHRVHLLWYPVAHVYAVAANRTSKSDQRRARAASILDTSWFRTGSLPSW